MGGGWRDSVGENKLSRRYIRVFEAVEVEGHSKELGGEEGTMSLPRGRRQHGRASTNHGQGWHSTGFCILGTGDAVTGYTCKRQIFF